ncbi:amidohydrolase family protein [Sphingomonas sp.]|uniref:amidohydrolase family protein n=1 Tax=Sphingomonas sp. TaxID=28214 RepID=UPI000DB0203B|nr:amidohydrolase family protein [Sphingomonas sp.]PZU10954.1 MAG: amidohydrolase [Sphingomonas sp.]
MTDTAPSSPAYRRIAAEEAFFPIEVERAYRDLLEAGDHGDPGFESAMGYFLNSPSERATDVRRRLLDLGDERIADMDVAGIDMQIIALTSPGVQVFRRDLAVGLAALSNDRLAEAVHRHPARFAGMIAIAPQDPDAAAREIERGTALGLKGIIVNSHTLGDYLDQPRFAAILEAAEACDQPLYVHPNTPSPRMIAPFLEAGLEGALFGFGVETALHALRLITSGAFDRYPKLRMVLGHLGEALPFWLYRLDFIHGGTVRSQRYDFMKPLQKPISGYMRENVWITTSGMAWQPAVSFTQQVLGVDRVLYAMDYPYQYVPDEVRWMDDLPLSPEQMKLFYEGNARQVFGL